MGKFHKRVSDYNLAANFKPGKFGNGRIEVRDAKTADIPALLRESDALITDYSSVHFDVAYVGSPVVYAQFDLEAFYTERLERVFEYRDAANRERIAKAIDAILED